MKKYYLKAPKNAVGTCLSALMLASPWAQAQQFTNGSFEEPKVGRYTNIANGAHIPGWDITEGDVSINRTTWTASDGDQTLELNGTKAGSISQKVSGFTPGDKYYLTLDYGLHPSAEYARAYVFIDGKNVGTIAAASSRAVPNYKSAKIEFSASASSLEFAIVNKTDGGKGLVLDNVSLSKSYDAVETQQEAARFLISSTFGPTLGAIKDLNNKGYSAWFRDQLSRPEGLTMPRTTQMFEDGGYTFGHGSFSTERFAKTAWWENALSDNDQLRQRAAFALSQIFVTSSNTDDWRRKIYMHASYQDILVKNAFGNFRDLMEDVTYSPMMGNWLTYLGSEKADPDTGSAPDENYAREIMQLFTIGLVELNSFGVAKTDSQGDEIPTYDADDIRGLAKVFTGLYWANRTWNTSSTTYQPEAFDALPMVMHNDHHSEGEKTFLGSTIPDYGDGDKTIDSALDIIFNHPNVGPFIVKQLIKRFTTSNPGPSYMLRVVRAFNNGVYSLPDGTTVGSGERGDMEAVWAGVLFGAQTFAYPSQLENWGKVREPIIRLTHWARVAKVTGTELSSVITIGGQSPIRATSVFNFYRPGYIAPQSKTAEMGYEAPELQISDGVNLIDYQNQMRNYTFRVPDDTDIDTSGFKTSTVFVPTYPLTTTFLDRRTVAQYIDYLNLVYTGNRMSAETVSRIVEAVEAIDLPDSGIDRQTGIRRRAAVAHFLVTTSINFVTQQTL